jgi:hypothetical protein
MMELTHMAAQGPRLSRSQEENLAAICAIGKDGLQRVADRLQAGGLLIHRSKIEEIITGQVGQELGPELARFVFGIAIGFRQDSSAPEAMLDRINAMVEQLPDRDVRFPGWKDCQVLLAQLLTSRSVRLAAKALEVSYDFERLYQAGRFLTTLRPVFDEMRQEILGATIVQTLRLEFFSAPGDLSSISIALDRGDIEQLRRSCDEALRKADITYEKASTVWGLPTVIPGEDAS